MNINFVWVNNMPKSLFFGYQKNEEPKIADFSAFYEV